MAGAPRGRGGRGRGGGAGEPGGGERASEAGGRRGLRACGGEFACPELEALFRGYALRLEQAGALRALAVLSLLAGALAGAELLGAPRAAAGLARGSHPAHCALFLALLVVTNVRSLRAAQLQRLGRLALLLSLSFALLSCPFALGGAAGEAAGSAAAGPGVWQLLLVTFVSYALLPVRSLLAVGFGLVVAASHLLLTATLVPAKRPRLWRMVSARGARPGWSGPHLPGGDWHLPGGDWGRGAGGAPPVSTGGKTEAPNGCVCGGWGCVQGHSAIGDAVGAGTGARLSPSHSPQSAPGTECGHRGPAPGGQGWLRGQAAGERPRGAGAGVAAPGTRVAAAETGGGRGDVSRRPGLPAGCAPRLGRPSQPRVPEDMGQEKDFPHPQSPWRPWADKSRVQKGLGWPGSRGVLAPLRRGCGPGSQRPNFVMAVGAGRATRWRGRGRGLFPRALGVRTPGRSRRVCRVGRSERPQLLRRAAPPSWAGGSRREAPLLPRMRFGGWWGPERVERGREGGRRKRWGRG